MMARATWIALLVALAAPAVGADNWPEFRGPSGNGHSDATGLPLKWSQTENITWKTAIHGKGWSSPVIWGEKIWMTTAENKGKELYAVCVDRRTGKVVHDVKIFDVDKPQRINALNSHASPTPMIEAGRVYVTFGTYGTACLDTKTAKVLWSRRDLNCDHDMGPGVSPIAYGDGDGDGDKKLLILPFDGCDVQFLVALDRKTGKTVWKAKRSVDYSGHQYDTRKAFCTPTVIELGGRRQLISPTAKAIIAYEPGSGKELWKVRTTGFSVIPRPLFGHGLVYVVIDCSRPELWAVKPGGKSKPKVVWRLKRGMPQRSSLLLIGDLLFGMTHRGHAVCIEAKTGKVVWKERVARAFSASPLYADGRIYMFSERRGTTVIEPTREYKQLAASNLGERIMASPGVAGKAIFLRTDKHLYRIEK